MREKNEHLFHFFQLFATSSIPYFLRNVGSQEEAKEEERKEEMGREEEKEKEEK